jgi:hypothetical protein
VQVKGKKTKRVPPFGSIRPVGSRNLDQHLAKILVNIANILLRNGYGFGRVSNLTKIAFVDAAKAIGTASGKRLSIARIAAVTGLTRIEVSRLLNVDRRHSLSMTVPFNRANRVARGWASDREFLGSGSRPKSLPFDAPRTSFVRLVRKYSGDIPARAMLLEMERQGMVRHDSRDVVSLVRENLPTSRATIAVMRAISPWVNYLANFEDNGRRKDLTSNTGQLKVYLDSIPEVRAATRELEMRRIAFVEGISQLGTRGKRDGKYELTISVAVAAAKPVVAMKRKQS